MSETILEELYHFPDDPRLAANQNDQISTASLFEPLELSSTMTLPHRIVMAPLTRSRTGSERTPGEMNATYYAQRASAALIISEATIISETGAGYALTPGIYNEAQIEGWKTVTDKVHASNGRMFCQLWHCGRVSHPDLLPHYMTPVAPSAIKIDESAGQAFTEDGMKDFVKPRALETNEVAALVQDYVTAARNAITAGFDGIEIHSANGYLLNQFLCDSTNTRNDQYGGSFENRCRLLLDVIDAVSAVWPSKSIGVRLSPWGIFLDCHDTQPAVLFSYLAEELNKRNLAYLSLVEREWLDDAEKDESAPPCITAFIRQYYKGTIITAGGYKSGTAAAIVESGDADLVAFGKDFLANPDLPKRIKLDLPLNVPNEDTFYGGNEKGYTDYPFLDE